MCIFSWRLHSKAEHLIYDSKYLWIWITMSMTVFPDRTQSWGCSKHFMKLRSQSHLTIQDKFTAPHEHWCQTAQTIKPPVKRAIHWYTAMFPSITWLKGKTIWIAEWLISSLLTYLLKSFESDLYRSTADKPRFKVGMLQIVSLLCTKYSINKEKGSWFIFQVKNLKHLCHGQQAWGFTALR